MRKTVAKRLRHEAAKVAVQSSEEPGLFASNRRKRYRTGKTDSKGREMFVFVDAYTARHRGFRRIYQDLKKAHREPDLPPVQFKPSRRYRRERRRSAA